MQQPTQDLEHLRLLAIFHYIAGGLGVVFSCLPIIHVAIGMYVLSQAGSHGGIGSEPPALVGLLFVLIGGAVFLIGEALAVCTIIAGWFLTTRKHYWFAFVVACLQCTLVPIGTVLGVFTLIVLNRPSVKHLFGLPDSTSAPIARTA